MLQRVDAPFVHLERFRLLEALHAHHVILDIHLYQDHPVAKRARLDTILILQLQHVLLVLKIPMQQQVVHLVLLVLPISIQLQEVYLVRNVKLVNIGTLRLDPVSAVQPILILM